MGAVTQAVRAMTTDAILEYQRIGHVTLGENTLGDGDILVGVL